MKWGPHVKMKKTTLNKRLKVLPFFQILQTRQKFNKNTYLFKPIWTHALQIFRSTKDSLK